MNRFARTLHSSPGRTTGRVAVAVAMMTGSVLAGPAAAVAAPAPGTPAAAKVCAAATPGHASCTAIKRTDIAPVKANKNGKPLSTTPSGYGAPDLISAYNIPAAPAGFSGTVAIVDAYDDPTAQSDLDNYRKQYGLPACDAGCFTKVSQTGSTTALPNANQGWAGEIAIDVEMASVSCPLCHILLVEANSASNSDLDAAEDYAASVTGVKAISNSWGGPESGSDNAMSVAHFNHPGIATLVASGDEGYKAEFPASSQYVIAVGGTSLKRSTTARGWSETVWFTRNHDGTSSGCSAYEPKPSWQTDKGCTNRTIADIAAVADPYTGVAVLSTYGDGGWVVYGGTSVASPLVAGLYALAGNSTAQSVYTAKSGLNDVTSGSDGRCSSSVAYLCTAGIGYDGPTGNGTPNGLAALTAP